GRRRVDARNPAADTARMPVVLDQQPVAIAMAVRKRIGDEMQRRLRRQPAHILQRDEIGDVFGRSIARRDADVPDVVARPRWHAREKSPKLHDVIVVTAASSNHAEPLRYLLESLRRLHARVDCYDLGLTAAEVRALPR